MIQIPRTPAPQARPQQVEVPQHFKEELEENPQQKLWVAAVDKKKGKKTWHQVTKAGWQISLASWSTACGWNFTKNPDKVTMSVALVFNQTRCIKCTGVMKARDKVKEGKNLAAFMQRDAAKWFDPNGGIHADALERSSSG